MRRGRNCSLDALSILIHQGTDNTNYGFVVLALLRGCRAGRFRLQYSVLTKSFRLPNDPKRNFSSLLVYCDVQQTHCPFRKRGDVFTFNNLAITSLSIHAYQLFNAPNSSSEETSEPKRTVKRINIIGSEKDREKRI